MKGKRWGRRPFVSPDLLFVLSASSTERMPLDILISKYETGSFHKGLVSTGIHTTVSPLRSFYFWGIGDEEHAGFHAISPFSWPEPLGVWGVEPPRSCASHFSPESQSPSLLLTVKPSPHPCGPDGLHFWNTKIYSSENYAEGSVYLSPASRSFQSEKQLTVCFLEWWGVEGSRE